MKIVSEVLDGRMVTVGDLFNWVMSWHLPKISPTVGGIIVVGVIIVTIIVACTLLDAIIIDENPGWRP